MPTLADTYLLNARINLERCLEYNFIKCEYVSDVDFYHYDSIYLLSFIYHPAQ